jgi:hypothetical protein
MGRESEGAYDGMDGGLDTDPVLDQFSAPKVDRFASATKELIDQADALAEQSADHRFLKSNHPLLTMGKYDNFTRDLGSLDMMSPSRMREIEHTYLQQYGAREKQPKTRKGRGFENIRLKAPEAYEVSRRDIAKLVFTFKNNSDLENRPFDVKSSKISNFLAAMKGQKRDMEIHEKLKVLKNCFQEAKRRKGLSEHTDSRFKRDGQDFKGQSSGNSAASEGLPPLEPDMNIDLDVIYETNQEQLSSHPNLADEIAGVWDELKGQGDLNRLHQRLPEGQTRAGRPDPVLEGPPQAAT